MARRIGREYITFYLTLPNHLRAWERAGFGPRTSPPMAAIGWSTPWSPGSPDAISERVDTHLDVGADHVCLHALDADPNALPVGAWRTVAPASHPQGTRPAVPAIELGLRSPLTPSVDASPPTVNAKPQPDGVM